MKKVMNRVKRGGVMVVVLLVMGLASCEKDALTGEATIHFTLSDSAYGSDEVRSMSRRRMEPETVVVPVEGELHAYATLEEDTESPLRVPGDATLDVGTRVLIVVYNSADDAYVNSFEYEVADAGGAIEPVGTTSGLTLTTGNYNFVAYSFNTTSVPPYAASITDGAPYSPNGNASDPLWGISGPHSITAGGTYNISIQMKHQFSQVKITAMTDGLAGTPTITAIDATLLGYEADAMTTLTGALTKGAAEDQPFTGFSTYGNTTVTSAARMVYAGGGLSTSIKITSATIGGTTSSIPAPVSFNKQLESGKSYTLRISFKNISWAKSNIYWVKTGTYDDDEDSVADGDVGYLTFDVTDQGHQGYQGVFFKWGSLVGISPALTNGGDNFTTATPVYIPTYVAGGTSTWHSPTTSSYTGNSTGWPWSNNGGTAEDAPENIPYLDGRVEFNASPPFDRYNAFVIDAERNTDAMYLGKRGDICQYLGKTQTALRGYRLPRSIEMGAGGSVRWENLTNGWEKGIATFPGADNSAGKADGTADLVALNKGSAKNPTLGVTLPASGIRNGAVPYYGRLSDVGRYGFYSTGSASNADTRISLLFFYNDYYEPVYIPYRSYAFPIRCVKN
jgi:hypothetical protein